MDQTRVEDAQIDLGQCIVYKQDGLATLLSYGSQSWSGMMYILFFCRRFFIHQVNRLSGDAPLLPPPAPYSIITSSLLYVIPSRPSVTHCPDTLASIKPWTFCFSFQISFRHFWHFYPSGRWLHRRPSFSSRSFSRAFLASTLSGNPRFCPCLSCCISRNPGRPSCTCLRFHPGFRPLRPQLHTRLWIQDLDPTSGLPR
jgi:hypothetical protein